MLPVHDVSVKCRCTLQAAPFALCFCSPETAGAPPFDVNSNHNHSFPLHKDTACGTLVLAECKGMEDGSRSEVETKYSSGEWRPAICKDLQRHELCRVQTARRK
jgi:hypothetical protein